MPHAETRADPFPDMRKRVLALLEKSGPNCFIGWDIARAGGDESIVARYMADGLGKLWLIPDYLPDEWLDRITLEVDADGKGHWLWTGWNNGQGHAKVRRDGKTLYCHRDIVERVTGRKLTRFQYVDHLCARKPCLNFDCLEVVLPGVNTHRGPGRHTQFKPAEPPPEPLQPFGTWREPLDAL